MAVVSINRIVAEAIAKPAYNNIVMYKRVDNGIDDGLTQVVDKDDYYKKVSQVYNSPDNIKTLIISHKRVGIEYHKAVVGTSDRSLKRAYDINVPQIEYRQELISTYGFIGANKMHRIAGLNKQNLDKLSGTGLGAISKPWVYQNLEEIYFDWVGLVGFINQYNADIRIDDTGDKMDIILKGILTDIGCTSLDELHNQFPRLRALYFIPSLYDVFDIMYQMISNKTDELLISQMINNSLITKNQIAGVDFFSNDSWKLNYSSKNNIYSFDREVLNEHFLKIAKGFKEVNQKLTDYSVNEGVINTLKNIEEQKGKAVVKAVIMAYEMTDVYSEEQIRSFIGNMYYDEIMKGA